MCETIPLVFLCLIFVLLLHWLAFVMEVIVPVFFFSLGFSIMFSSVLVAVMLPLSLLSLITYISLIATKYTLSDMRLLSIWTYF